MKLHIPTRHYGLVPAVIFLSYILLCRLCPTVAEGYARHIYPLWSCVLSAASSVFPFSLEEILVMVLLVFLLVYPFRARRKGQTWRHILARTAGCGLWLIIWFYMCWGNNYFRHDFFTRTQSAPVPYDKTGFHRFLDWYTDSLHACYTPQPPGRQQSIADIRALFASLPEEYGLCKPHPWQRPKRLLCNSLYSGVVVLGYMGPFFCEMQLNHDLLPQQYAFTYAHELSHLLGVSNEAEANFWAYYICTRARNKELRSCGYLNILPYVAANARRLLPEQEYRQWVESLNPEIVKELEYRQAYWHSRYNPFIGAIQD